MALHEVISSCRKTPFEEIDGKKQAKDTLLGLLFHKLRSCVMLEEHEIKELLSPLREEIAKVEDREVA